jgi:hypothetical protein
MEGRAGLRNIGRSETDLRLIAGLYRNDLRGARSLTQRSITAIQPILRDDLG